jgi:hypothetical protein
MGRRRPATELVLLGVRALGVRPLGVALAMALCAGPVHASCAIAFEGDAAVIARVRAELGSFADDGSACVALWVQCQQNGDQVQIDLHDELGRSALHLFASAVGAAAFLVSWSRRPVEARSDAPDAHAAIARGAPGDTAQRPTPGPPSATGDPGDGWRAEFGLDYLATSGLHVSWAALAAAMTNHTGIWRYGAGVTGLTVAYLGSYAAEASAALGVAVPLLPRVVATGGLVAGETIVASQADNELDYGAAGLRIGVRAGVLWQVTAPVALAVTWGYDLMWLSVPPPSGGGTFASVRHLGIGMRWVP